MNLSLLPSAAGTAGPARTRQLDAVAFLERWGIFLVLLLLVVGFSLENARFLSLRNVSNILTEVSIFGISAVGMTFVILTGGVDLAVGSLLAFAAMCAASVLVRFTGPVWLHAPIAILVAGGVGLVVGWLHGLGITRLAVPPFVVTLGGMTVWRGGTLILNHGGPISGLTGIAWWGRGAVLGVPVPVLVFGIVAVIGGVVLRYTRFGRAVYAVGGNPEAARLVGLDTRRVLVRVYMIVGLLAGLSGFMLAARLGSAEAVAGVSYELRVIAAVVIGGTSLMGGLGGVGGTVVGSVLIGVLQNGLVMLNVSSYYQQVAIGLIIVVAVALDTLVKSRRLVRRSS